MGTMKDKWKQLPDLRPTLRLPISVLVVALLWVGFFPQSLVRLITPPFRTYFATK
jgi:NADH:ubiquinone oxidoreductase subunit 4 (subunit M)